MKNRMAENIIWAASAVMLIIYMIVFVLVSDSEFILAGIVFGVVTLIMLCATVFAEGRNKQGCLVTYAILVMGSLLYVINCGADCQYLPLLHCIRVMIFCWILIRKTYW